MSLPQLFVIGDSISVHYGPYLERMLHSQMHYARRSGEEAALRNLDIPVGANSGDSAAVLAYLRAMRHDPQFHPDVLLLNCGLHDIKTDPATGAKQVPLTAYGENLREILDVARGICDRFIWVRTTPVDDVQHNTRSTSFHRFGADVEQYNAVADIIMREAGVPLLDLFTFTANLGDGIFCDHVHFIATVRQAQAAFIAGYLAGHQA